MAQDKKSENEEDENNKIDVEYHVAPPEEEEESNLKGDYRNVAILLFLYILQGIPLGISSAVRILLQNRGVSYKEQALFSLAAYPFTMKVLWCPIVDALYLKRFGRRKSWLVPVQILIGAFMIILSLNVNEWLGDGEGNQPQIVLLTVVFFILWFLTATQDIVVDGWCLTMLQRRNVGYAATTNSCGQTGGWFIGYVILLVFESPEFCNKYIFSEPRTEGLITLAGFLKFWGVVFLITTVLIALFKKERSELDYELEEHPDYGVKKAYPILWEIVKLKPVLKLTLVLLTAKAGFAACDVVTSLKLIEYGMPKEKAALLAIPLVPIQLVLPFIISRYTAGPRPMSFYIKAFPYRLLMTIVIGLFVFFTPIMKTDDGFPFYFYALLVCIYMVYQIPFRSMYICDMSFFAKISDPLIGGTYMTLMNTITNLGGSWVQTFFLWFVDVITWRRCIFDEELLSSNSTSLPLDNKCSDKIEKEICTKSGGKCHTDIEGYYIEIGINVVYGIVWFFLVKNLILYLQSLPAKDWYVLSRKEEHREMVQVSKDK